MSLIRPTLSVLALLCATVATPVLAASSAASSASESSTAISGSVSDSIHGSSNSSSGAKKIAAGEYRVQNIAAADRPGMVTVHLQGEGELAQQSFDLVLPAQAAAAGQLVEGGVVAARERDYGWEFASATTQEAFFLVVADEVYRDLQTRIVQI